MKFTEEQYQKIVEVFEKVNDEYNMGFLNPNVVTFFQDKLYKEFGDVMYFVEDWQFITAFANPLTREWAHDKFVEKEPEFHFILKNTHDSERWSYHLVINGRGAIILFPWSEENDDKPLFKESEIIKWGFNPEMFDR